MADETEYREADQHAEADVQITMQSFSESSWLGSVSWTADDGETSSTVPIFMDFEESPRIELTSLTPTRAVIRMIAETGEKLTLCPCEEKDEQGRTCHGVKLAKSNHWWTSRGLLNSNIILHSSGEKNAHLSADNLHCVVAKGQSGELNFCDECQTIAQALVEADLNCSLPFMDVDVNNVKESNQLSVQMVGMPIIDIGPLLNDKEESVGYQNALARLVRASADAGFFMILNHGISVDLQSIASKLADNDE
eukprot:gene1031-1871_t